MGIGVEWEDVCTTMGMSPDIWESEHRPVQVVHNVFKNFTQGIAFFKKIFSQGQWISSGPV